MNAPIIIIQSTKPAARCWPVSAHQVIVSALFSPGHATRCTKSVNDDGASWRLIRFFPTITAPLSSHYTSPMFLIPI